MAPHKTVTISGRQYDAVTGLPIENIGVTNPDKTPIKTSKPAPTNVAPQASPVTSRGQVGAESSHSGPQRSQTLNRRAAKKPVATQKPVLRRPAPGRHMDMARSTNVARFAKDPVVQAPAQPKPIAPPAAASKHLAKTQAKMTKAQAKATSVDKPAQVHPMAQRALDRSNNKKAAQMIAAAKAKQAANATPKQIKDEAIDRALATPKKAPVTKKKGAKKTKFKGFVASHRRMIIIIASVAVFLLAVGIAWRMVPSISVSVAAAQAGISATYPEFTPDGYSLNQPVTFSDGEVNLKFKSNSNGNYYTIKQTRSSWDSTAVLDNVVSPEVGANYVTTKEKGLTIYSFDSSAAWVNGGILYRIDSEAPLTGDQIRKIATSL